MDIRRVLICAIVASLGLCVFLAGCSLIAPKFEKPRLSLSGVQLLEGNLFQQNFLAHLHVQNPNDRELPVNGIQLELSLEGQKVATGVTDRAFTVAPFGQSNFDMVVSANMATGLLKLLKKANRNDGAIDYEMQGSVSLDMAFVQSLPFHERGSFKLDSLKLR